MNSIPPIKSIIDMPANTKVTFFDLATGEQTEYVNAQVELDPLKRDKKYHCKIVPSPKTCPECGGELESQKHDDTLRSWEKCKTCGRNFVMFHEPPAFVNLPVTIE